MRLEAKCDEGYKRDRERCFDVNRAAEYRESADRPREKVSEPVTLLRLLALLRRLLLAVVVAERLAEGVEVVAADGPSRVLADADRLPSFSTCDS